MALTIVFVTGVAALFGADRYYRAEVESDNSELHAIALKDTQIRLSETLEQYVFLADSLRAFLLAAPELPDSATFDRYASLLQPESPELRALQYADSAHIIRYIYPLAGNQEALGLDLMTRPAADVVRQVMETGHTLVGAPVITVQGSLSVVIRSPMFRQGQYIGQAAVVVDILPLLESVFSELSPAYSACLQDRSGRVFWGEGCDPASGMRATVPIANDHWYLLMHSDPGMPIAPSRRVLGMIWGLGGALVFSVMLTTLLLFRRVSDLYEAVDQRTAELAASEARYRSLVETTDDAIVLADLDYNILFANHAFYRSQGFESAEDADFNAFNRAHPEDRDRILQQLERLEEKDTLSAEYRIRHRDGHWVHRQARFNLVRDEQRQPTAILLVAHDITERKRAEREIEFQARLLDMVEQAVVAADRDGTITYWNRYAELQFGWSAEEAIGKDTRILKSDEVTPELEAEFIRALRSGHSWSGALELQRKDGSTFPGEVTASPVYDAGGKQVGLVSVSLDITDRLRREKELSDARDLLEATFASLNAAIFVINPSNRSIVLCNPAVEEIFGYRPDELIGGGTEILHVDAESHKRFGELGDPELARQGYFRTQYEMRHRDGSIIQTENTVLSLAGKESWTNDLVVSVVRDISEQKRLEVERNELEERYLRAQKLEAVGQLTAGIAHDFNNLLMAITGNAQLMELSLGDEEALRKQIGSILEAGFRAADLIGQLLIFSRKEVLRPQVVDLNEVIGKTGEMLQRVIREDIEFVLDLAQDLWPVLADPGQLDQVVANLAVNARDAMPDGGQLTISTENVLLDESQVDARLDQRPGEYIRMRVRDTGTGMGDEVRSHIFEPFFTTKPPGHGTGLGLATVYGIVERAGGHIAVHSEPGSGSTFDVYLPRYGFEGGLVSTYEPPTPRPGTLSRGRGTVLLVEDDDAVRKLARGVLRRQGYTVLDARNPAEALQAVERHGKPFDLLLTDVVMPGGSGKELADTLLEQYPEARVLYMSGYSYDIISNRGLLEDGIDLLQKPFSVFELVERVQKALA